MSEKNAKKPHYVNSKVFLEQLVEYYETDVITEELGDTLMKIAEGLSYKINFIRYSRSWKDEMVGDAILKMYAAMEKKLYKLDSGYNPFSYFNRIAWNAFCNRIKKENGQHKGLEDYKEMVYMESMSGSDSMGHVYVKPNLGGDEYDDE